jgi:uncharacterized protein (TIGR03032 family)
MSPSRDGDWAEHDRSWRDPAQIASQWEAASETDPRMLRQAVRGDWWEALERSGSTLIVSREYEHLLVALGVENGRPRVSFMRLPHPSGLAFDRDARTLHVASTRNPNQIYELAPVTRMLPRADSDASVPAGSPLVPRRSTFLPGALYVHDLAMVGSRLHANAVGENAVVRIDEDGFFDRVWWPRCIERRGQPAFDRNYLQLNSIAAGKSLRSSFFTASADRISSRRPGHRNFPVDGRGVVFSGATREVVARGLTRPHSARLHRDRLWVDNSGYGELVQVDDGSFEPLTRLPGWTRGLCFSDGVAFVATSRVIPRFRNYAPGLDLARSVCGVHAVELRSGEVLGSIRWPAGNQIFSVELVPRRFSLGFPFLRGRRRQPGRLKALFYGFSPAPSKAKR